MEFVRIRIKNYLYIILYCIKLNRCWRLWQQINNTGVQYSIEQKKQDKDILKTFKSYSWLTLRDIIKYQKKITMLLFVVRHREIISFYFINSSMSAFIVVFVMFGSCCYCLLAKATIDRKSSRLFFLIIILFHSVL